MLMSYVSYLVSVVLVLLVSGSVLTGSLFAGFFAGAWPFWRRHMKATLWLIGLALLSGPWIVGAYWDFVFDTFEPNYPYGPGSTPLWMDSLSVAFGVGYFALLLGLVAGMLFGPDPARGNAKSSR